MPGNRDDKRTPLLPLNRSGNNLAGLAINHIIGLASCEVCEQIRCCKIQQNRIQPIIGAPSDDPETVVKAYLDGTLQTNENICDH